MPNHVTNKIEFEVGSDVEAEQMVAELTKDGCVDFNALIPRPLHIYRESTTGNDDKDFGANTWHEWNSANWGTKWNAYNGKVEHEAGTGKVVLTFDTAWRVPYPFIIAFANKYGSRFLAGFTHKYFDEGHNFWGQDEWEGELRKRRERDNEDMKRALCIELKDYDPAEDECA